MLIYWISNPIVFHVTFNMKDHIHKEKGLFLYVLFVCFIVSACFVFDEDTFKENCGSFFQPSSPNQVTLRLVKLSKI